MACYLYLAEFWYNTSFHSALGRSPFEALVWTLASSVWISAPPAAHGNLTEWLSERTMVNELVRQHLLRAQEHRLIRKDHSVAF